ncbi:acetylornithine deacetylase/succinyl-diaminopimelate desuccinylase-like protein [Deinobacterium chartae]|uniref:Acetylornithine deacetylase/succinyl-diaminopimelate desuccinylase-like protein n=1 Tax=Deinobacterium chartae TaxID=521158 RepID=A0A841I1U9_9DEIO|nr:M20/M25/M40 family metallo-hydrolase [Deinobacterium chartae]MBB6098369.1 acetylornithine deacetylase/succinyl-diaminopimelate desuccinylase-like protein [Deinobacterium chartae]
MTVPPPAQATSLEAFLRDLIRIRALPGHEADICARVVTEMQALGFDHAFADAAGNAIGVVRGRERGPAWLLITHLDHVHEGDPTLWAHPPYAGHLEGDVVHGRGAVDIKGPLSAQVHALGALIARGERPRSDVIVAAFVEEETGGRGADAFLRSLPLRLPGGDALEVGAAIVGEPSSNRVMLGHRGVAHVHVRLRGEAHHASLGLHERNPLFALAELMRRVQALELPTHPVVGRTTLSPTQVSGDSGSENLTCNTVSVVLDWRASESEQDMRATLNALLTDLPAEGELAPLWTPKNTPGFHIAPDHPLVATLLRHAGHLHPEPGIWNFATDGRYTFAHGIPTVGFGPGDSRLAHTTREQVSLEELRLHAGVLGTLLLEESPPR